MKTKKVIISDSGETLAHANDGFIVLGSIFKSELSEEGSPTSGLFGGSESTKKAMEEGFELRAYNVKEFLTGLRIDPYLLKRIAEELMVKEGEL